MHVCDHMGEWVLWVLVFGGVLGGGGREWGGKLFVFNRAVGALLHPDDLCFVHVLVVPRAPCASETGGLCDFDLCLADPRICLDDASVPYFWG